MDLKNKIADAAEQVLLRNGLAKTTTKEIARTAGCSEGSLYNHFSSKEDLFVHVIRGQLKHLMRTLSSLQTMAGKDTVRTNLEQVTLAALEDFHSSMPLIGSIFSEPGLLLRQREGFELRNEGPHRANEAVEAYLNQEKQLGRVGEGTDSRAIADLLLGSCFQHAFQINFLGKEEPPEERAQFAARVLDTLSALL
ncbi:TetR family transcriptional regulator [Paenibacillus sp. SSG-1]|uniref:TetR/AcrR family transcriptional regulator n=1 Tax=unclassified Paenibacillus TaxID=185978 RepID=UPI000B7FEB2D|nr:MULTISPECIES: TetR/AcrR family transcriptional regulator [unclassified Paenibacillus]OXL86481.1 TetR family transcriptional regulator [Paenibacillus sp. SSG-1]UYO05781.1 TetR/AcrR family transcriptional regulator [Paenibacillus sp. PSB04]